MSTEFGIYIHIPYCVQKCLYCDFATFEKSKIFPIQEYTEILCQEIKARIGLSFQTGPIKKLSTIYFGGGTPSLLSEADFEKILGTIREVIPHWNESVEITVEVNPETLTAEKLKRLVALGINRWSVGVQTFSDGQLKRVGRKHSVEQTKRTLHILAEADQNFSVDLLYALPHQTREDVRFDIENIFQFSPNHISGYCLTLKDDHILQKGRPGEVQQLEMIRDVTNLLQDQGYIQYEISNYAKPGFESRHNSLYWDFSDYLAFGLSAHGFDFSSRRNGWGIRYWNSRNLNEYVSNVEQTKNLYWQSVHSLLPLQQRENLQLHEALTDFCHVRLRTAQGLQREFTLRIFADDFFWTLLLGRGKSAEERGLLRINENSMILTIEGQALSNQVFLDFTFSPHDVEARVGQFVLFE